MDLRATFLLKSKDESMQVTIDSKGNARIKLTKNEQGKLESAKRILDGISKFEPQHVASDELSLVLKRIGDDGVFVPAVEE